ncbi:UDP-glucose 4-epimerase GalE [Providencia heimbachae]|uniref:UDP-glucose 4-epimerase n=1 Tax=Providencia heimbachae ATCC 35613 TaxID=1354272 RepID=A0A1B7JJ81_9GAMM|nr:UDP-glucose 4-epimerase GalE [Providencia heimbachae]OAT47971.1 UDP-glucose 4-epimerase [Providencia heimbachae ATCC 35613]SQH12618.1 UDP-glucose 4-epimerase [Providencia heimbachae]
MRNVEVLVTGGLGYIGSHTCVQMIAAGISPVILDNLCNSKMEVLNRIEKLAGYRPTFYHGDVRDEQCLATIFSAHQIQSVIHFAGLKAVGESVEKPIEYYDVNVNGTLVLVRCMQQAGVKSLIFSSSATVYGEPATLPITEEFPTGNTQSPYGTSKYMVERCLSDLYLADNSWSISLLRYFNPVGAHSSGLMGEDPQGIPNNLTPYIAQVAVGRRAKLAIYGNDYPTIDGTGVRDYIHVMDLADGHVLALNVVGLRAGLHVYNLGTGNGSSVLQVLQAFEKATSKPIPYVFEPRRAGDIAEYWSSPEKAASELGWRATRSIEDMAVDTWRWQLNNPNGYEN